MKRMSDERFDAMLGILEAHREEVANDMRAYVDAGESVRAALAEEAHDTLVEALSELRRLRDAEKEAWRREHQGFIDKNLEVLRELAKK